MYRVLKTILLKDLTSTLLIILNIQSVLTKGKGFTPKDNETLPPPPPLNRDSIELPFRSYIDKYNPKNVWERVIEVSKTNGKSLNQNDTIDALLAGLDETDDLLSLKVQKTALQFEEKDGRRQWYPPGRLVTRLTDTYSIRHRIFGLIQTAIYQARMAMTMMQTLRKKYRHNSLYKMGFLMSKTDNSCRVFAKFAKFAMRYCSLYRYHYSHMRTKLKDMLYIEEKQLTLLFEVELLVDLVKLNDKNVREMMKEVFWDRKEKWKFVD